MRLVNKNGFQDVDQEGVNEPDFLEAVHELVGNGQVIKNENGYIKGNGGHSE